MKKPIEIPPILSANTYFWKPGQHASSRRTNEERRQKTVYDFFNSLGLNVEWENNTVSASGEGLDILFYYKESCGNVYKNLEITRNGKLSNISSIKKLVLQRNARFLKIESVLQAA